MNTTASSSDPHAPKGNPFPPDEVRRLALLRRHHILDTPPEEAYDRLAELAAQICDTPIALVSLVDAERLWFKAHHGLAIAETPRASAFCAHAILQPQETLVVTDALLDERFRDNALVISNPRIRFYAGAPLLMPDGHALGTLCVLDTQPRMLSDRQLMALETLRQSVVRELLLHRWSDAAADQSRAKQVQAKLTERLNLATRSAHMGIWDWDIPQNELVWDEQMYALYGLKPGEFGGAYEAWLSGIHPDDRAAGNEASAAAVRGEKEYDTEFRILWPDGSVHWLKADAQVFRDVDGTPLRMVGVNYDITERKRLEERLRESEQKYSLLFMRSMVPTVLLRLPEVVIVEVNDAFVQLTGIARSEAAGRTAAELGLATHEERTKVIARFDALGRLAGQEIELRTKAGETRIVSVNTVPVKIGERSYAITTMQDLTERKQAEEKLRRRTEELEQLLDLLPEAIWIADDPECMVIRGNRFANGLLGTSKDDNLSQSADAPAVVLRQFSQGRELMPDELPMQMAARTGKPQLDIELRIEHPSRAPRTLFGGAIPLFDADGKIRGTVASFQDITERKKAEERFQRFFKSNPVGMNILDLVDGRIVDVNDAYLAIFGVTREKIIGKTPVEAGLAAHPEQRLQFQAILHEPGRLPQREIEFLRHSGEKGHVIISSEVIEIGEKQYALIATSDITERKRMEEELRRSNAELEQFAYVASHDLQEPLRAVAGMVQLLAHRYRGQLDEQADEYIGHAIEAANRMQALINDLLEYSRVDRRGKSLEPVQASDCLQVALRNLDVSIRETGTVVTAEELPLVHADATQLSQLFQNLLGNAIKFHGDTEPRIHVGVSKLNDAWQFSVSDNGIGIEPQYFERIFLVFQRLHTRREYTGTGIGLALCKKIVERHGGTIWVESRPGQGSTFYFTLPIKNR